MSGTCPAVTRVAVIRDPAITAGIGMFGAIQSVAPSLGVEVSPVNVRDPDKMENAIAAFARERWTDSSGECISIHSSRRDRDAGGSA